MTSTGPMLAPLRPLRRSQPTESPAPTLLSTPVRLPKLQRVPPSFRRLLDFDLETVAAGFADPEWVPQTITAWAHTWDGNHVEVATLAVADFYNLNARRQFLAPLREAIRQADILTGHNITRFDLPVLNADLMRVGLDPLDPVLVQDTIRLPKSKGFKKGQDVLSDVLGVKARKQAMNWAEWAAGYASADHALIRDRVAGDVRQHVELRQRMLEAGWLQPPRMWKP